MKKDRRYKLRVWRKANRLLKFIYPTGFGKSYVLNSDDRFALLKFDAQLREAMKELNNEWSKE